MNLHTLRLLANFSLHSVDFLQAWDSPQKSSPASYHKTAKLLFFRAPESFQKRHPKICSIFPVYPLAATLIPVFPLRQRWLISWNSSAICPNINTVAKVFMTFKLFEVEFGTSHAPDLGILQAEMVSSMAWIRGEGNPYPWKSKKKQNLMTARTINQNFSGSCLDESKRITEKRLRIDINHRLKNSRIIAHGPGDPYRYILV